ncbi:MAG: GntR family transcriptional regulator [Nitrospinae bacterium]|nr:GntR family transcriptional regulator [Nitrospinota bacterium]
MRIPGVQIEKPKSLSKMVSEQIKDAILSGIFQPGDKLVETTLTESMGVSRTPLREAFRELAAEGYITVVPHKGAHVSLVSEDEVLDIYAITSVLEGLATRLATPNLREGRANERLHAFFEQLKRRHEHGEVDAYWAANRDFHRHITSACENSRLQGLIGNLRQQIMKTRVVTLHAPGRLDNSMAEHEDILQAILDGDGRGAEHLVIRHLEIQGKFVLDLIKKSPENASIPVAERD